MDDTTIDLVTFEGDAPTWAAEIVDTHPNGWLIVRMDPATRDDLADWIAAGPSRGTDDDENAARTAAELRALPVIDGRVEIRSLSFVEAE